MLRRRLIESNSCVTSGRSARPSAARAMCVSMATTCVSIWSHASCRRAAAGSRSERVGGGRAPLPAGRREVELSEWPRRRRSSGTMWRTRFL